MRVFLGCGDLDQHIDIAIAERSAEAFRAAGAEVDFRRYPGFHHAINEDELDAAKALLTAIAARSADPAIAESPDPP